MGDSAEHRLHCAFSAWALVGFVQRWVAQTDASLAQATSSFAELHESAIEVSARYLLRETDGL